MIVTPGRKAKKTRFLLCSRHRWRAPLPHPTGVTHGLAKIYIRQRLAREPRPAEILTGKHHMPDTKKIPTKARKPSSGKTSAKAGKNSVAATSGNEFGRIREMVQGWCADFRLRNLLTVRECDGDLHIVARKDDTSMDLKARRDMNAYLVATPRRKREEYLARLYVSEMPDASIVIFSGNGAWRWRRAPAKTNGAGVAGAVAKRWACDGLEAEECLFDEEAFAKMICQWLEAYFSMKSVYYYA